MRGVEHSIVDAEVEVLELALPDDEPDPDAGVGRRRPTRRRSISPRRHASSAAAPGLRGPEQFEQLHELGASLGASVGATRVITDRGWVRHERQIGTTGVVVDPRLYLAFGISGAVQHTSGLGHPITSSA